MVRRPKINPLTPSYTQTKTLKGMRDMRLRAGRAWIKTPKHMEKMHSFTIRVGSAYYSLCHVEAHSFPVKLQTYTGVPSHFCVRGKEILFAPAPDKNYYAEICYTQYVTK